MSKKHALWVTSALLFIFMGLPAKAAVSTEKVSVEKSTLFSKYLAQVVKDKMGRPFFIHDRLPKTAEEYVLAGATKFPMDDLRQNLAGKSLELQLSGREEERQQAMEVLIRYRGRAPIFVGPSGVGKSTIAEMLSEDIFNEKYPPTTVYQEIFNNAEIIETTPSRISQMALSNEPTAQAAAIENFFKALRLTQENFLKNTGKSKPIILFIDDIETMDPPQYLALKRELENTTMPISVIGGAITEVLNLKMKQAPAVRKAFKYIPVREFTEEQTVAVLQKSWVPFFEQKYNVAVNSEALTAIVRTARYLEPNLSRPEGPFQLLQDLMVNAHTVHAGELSEINEIDVYNYARKITGIPSNPFNAREFSEYLTDIKKYLKSRVVNQDHLAEILVDLWAQILSGDPQKPLSALFIGPTGSGKTLIADLFAKKAFSDQPGRIFELDGTMLQDGKFALGSVFGVPMGVSAAETSSGSFMEWLDDPARGKMGGIIVINEADKMHPDVWQRLMEFIDRGVIYGGDGKPRFANRHMLVFTSNKGTREIFPPSTKMWSNKEISDRIKGLSEADIKNYFIRPDPNNTDEIVLRPEILGRFTRAAVSNPITVESAPAICDIETQLFSEKAYQSFKIKLDVDPKLKLYLSSTGIDLFFGARPLRDQINRYFTLALTEARKTWDIPRDGEIKLSLQTIEAGEVPKIKVEFQGQSLLVDAPEQKFNNPLDDSDVRKMLSELDQKLRDHMVEQPEAVDAVVTAVKARFGDASRRRPVSITLVGTTGVGKTEFGRALAFGLYKSTERISIIPLGEIHNSRESEAVFSAPGGKIMGQLEKALKDNPQGGVIVLDEFSNMGGNDLEMKNALIKKFYTMLEEGFWVSPQSGELFDLRKYTFIFTGNDLERLLQKVTSDDQRLTIWQQNRAREKVQQILVENGVPEAFLGRQDAVLLLRPLVADAQSRVTDKLLLELKSRMEEQHRGINLTWDENSFSSQMANAFFSHSRGARSVRSVIENQLSSLITESLLEYGYSAKNINGLEVHLKLQDNLPEKNYVKGEVPPREIKLQLDIKKDGQVVHSAEKNVTESAPVKVVLTEDEARSVAFREMGRAVVNDLKQTKMKFEFATIASSEIDGEMVYGYSRFTAINGSIPKATRSALVAQLAVLWAGRVSMELAGFEPDSQWLKDLSEMRKMANQYLVQYGLQNGLEAVRVNEKGEAELSGEQKQAFLAEMKSLFDESKQLAEKTLKDKWKTVQTLVDAILKNGELSSALYTELTGDKQVLSCGDFLK